MDRYTTQHISQNTLKTYYLNFDENGDKTQELFDVLMDSLLEFVFGINYMNVVNPKLHSKFFNACEKLYKEKRDSKREGDLGEIILHTILRKYVGTLPFTGRFYFAVDKNTNAKSYDAIHILPNPDKNILVLGESKMYTDAKSGIDALVDDIKKHFKSDYTRKQFVKISEFTFSESLDISEQIVAPMKRQINDWEISLRTSETLEGIVDELCVPLLCTYTYDEYTNHKTVTEEFISNYETEIAELYRYFTAKDYECPICLSVILLLFPVPNKNILINEYYKRIDAEATKYD
ncbi:MAG: DUF1837 domain-containing protein [Candidatus Gastranaerophilales bacterium]|nr:DUF1837 domain-containing protein [Candidatus Gastranaerophilales bacterium]